MRAEDPAATALADGRNFAMMDAMENMFVRRDRCPRLSPRLAGLFLLVALLLPAPLLAAGDDDMQDDRAGGGMSGQTMPGGMNGGSMSGGGMSGSTGNPAGSRATEESGASRFKSVVDHDPTKKTILNRRIVRPKAAPVNPIANPTRTDAEMAEHNRGVRACVASCWTRYNSWLEKCVALTKDYPCGSNGDRWYYNCQHDCANGK